MSVEILKDKELVSKLNNKYASTGHERGGVILPDGKIVEIRNRSKEPEASFMADGSELVLHIDQAIATWHTHPNESSNLSVGDWQTFLQWPDIHHLIVGNNGVATYQVESNRVVQID